MKHDVAYRVFTLVFIISIFVSTGRMAPHVLMSFQHSGFPNALYSNLPFLGTLLIPLYLIWRNFSSIQKKIPFLSSELIHSKNWIFLSAITFVWISVFIIGVFVLSYIFYKITGSSYSIAKFTASYIFQGHIGTIGIPTIFAIELLTMYYSKPNA